MNPMVKESDKIAKVLPTTSIILLIGSRNCKYNSDRQISCLKICMAKKYEAQAINFVKTEVSFFMPG
jgi:hypothetical protein